MLTSPWHRLFALAAIMALSGCNHSQRAPPTSDAIDAALQLAAGKQWLQAESSFNAITSSHAFARLPSADQYRALMGASRVESALTHLDPEYRYLIRALNLPQAGFEQRRLQINLAYRLNYTPDVIAGLTILVRQDPERLKGSTNDFVFQVIRHARRAGDNTVMPLLQALFAAHWKPYPPLEPSTTWHDLTLMLIAKGRYAEAAEVADRVTEPYLLLAMRADRRFDPISTANPAHFDPEKAADLYLRELITASEAKPNVLEFQVDLAIMLLRHQRAAAALAVLDAAILELRSTNYPERAYVDYTKQLPRLMDTRAGVLASSGRWDEALEQEVEGTRVLRDPHGDINHRIDLGALYVRLGRPLDALEATSITTNRGDFGNMELEVIRLEAAAELTDRTQISRLLASLRAQHSIDPKAFQEALVAANQLQAAARVLIERLRDPLQRLEALLDVQLWVPQAMTDWDREMAARMMLILDRKDVRSEINKVGRIDHCQLINY